MARLTHVVMVVGWWVIWVYTFNEQKGTIDHCHVFLAAQIIKTVRTNYKIDTIVRGTRDSAYNGGESAGTLGGPIAVWDYDYLRGSRFYVSVLTFW